MSHQTFIIDGKTYVVIEQEEYDRLTSAGSVLPPLPRPDAGGNVDAVAYARAAIARKIISARQAAGLSQTELARAAGVRVETLNRLENAKHTADFATLAKIERALGTSSQAPRGRGSFKTDDYRMTKSGAAGGALINTGTEKRFVRRDASGQLIERGQRRHAATSERGSTPPKPRAARRSSASKRTPKK